MKPDAIDKAYRKYHKELYLYALSLCRNEELAMDLVSEAFYRAFIASNRPRGPFKYWLFRVLKNHFFDLKRKKDASLTLNFQKEFLQNDKVQGPADRLLKKEKNQKLYRYVMELEPESYREVLTLYYYAGLSLKEIASASDISETNAKTLLYRARKKLGKHLKEDSYEF